jgi:hypothetical protein
MASLYRLATHLGGVSTRSRPNIPIHYHADFSQSVLQSSTKLRPAGKDVNSNPIQGEKKKRKRSRRKMNRRKAEKDELLKEAEKQSISRLNLLCAIQKVEDGPDIVDISVIGYHPFNHVVKSQEAEWWWSNMNEINSQIATYKEAIEGDSPATRQDESAEYNAEIKMLY